MRALLGLCWLLGTQAAVAEELDPAQVKFFEDRIRPVLVQHCYECHAADAKQLRGGLRVDARDLIRTGGDSGPAVVPGDVAGSLLIEALRYESYEMPPKGKLPDDVIADFVKWVEMGAPDPRDEAGEVATAGIDIEAGREFWSFRPLSAGDVPQPADAAWSKSDIDRFLRARQETAGLSPGPDADRRALIRRATFDLTGLPPTPDEITAFLNDDDPDAFARLIDRLLESPQFGVRWGRHWLDTARYADSTGGGRSMLYDESWRYRDYVIDSFNRDKPFDRFIIEQIAGDLLPYDDYEQGREQLIGTAFLALGPTNYEEQDKDVLRMDVIDEQIDTIGRAFMGMTIGCARCHDHKFDPIPTADYYALAGIFRSTQTLIHDNVSTWVKTPLPMDAEQQQLFEQHSQAVAALQARIDTLQTSLQALKSQLPIVTVDDEELKQFTGSWSQSSGVKEFVGKGYSYASGGSALAEYPVPLRYAGRYEVRVSYTAHENRSPNALVRVRHKAGETEVRIDQRVKPPIEDLYIAVGQFEFDSGVQSVTVSTEGTTGAVVADAVQFVPLFRVEGSKGGGRIVADASTLPGVVVDNTAAELVGDWTPSVYTKSFVGEGYIHDNREGRGTKRVVYRADLPSSGKYDVRVSYTFADSRATRIPVRITLPGREETIYLNQREEPNIDGLFATLGTYEFSNDQTAVVTISNEGTDDGHVIADAVQFLPVELIRTPAAKQPDAVAADASAMDVLAQLTAQEAELTGLSAEMTALKQGAPPAPETVVAVKDEDQEVGDYHICIRGNPKNLGDVAPRGFLTVAMTGPAPKIGPDSSGRLELARWVASPENPLTARVAANRVWSHLFGVGLVRTVDNFGSTGELPSHPELLDHLAARLIEHNWSVKELIRAIMHSRTYQLSSLEDAASGSADPENVLLTRQNRRRLQAEAIYDSILALSGELDLSIGGKTVRADTKSEYGYKFDIGRRAAFLPVFRNQLPDLFAVFDFPDPNLSQGRRVTTTLPTQALFLMNSPFVAERARIAAEKLMAEETDTAGRIDLLYERGLGRLPTEAERALALEFLGEDPAVEHWTGLAHALISSIDFRYVE